MLAKTFGRLALSTIILQRFREGDALAIGAWLLVAIGARCQETLHCRFLTVMIFFCLGADHSLGFRAVLCVLAVWAPLFAPKEKPLVELDEDVQRGTSWRAQASIRCCVALALAVCSIVVTVARAVVFCHGSE
jgi:hypothetical protein